MKSKIIGQNIKYYRQESRLTQVKLAEKIGVSYETLSKMERGIYGITLEKLMAISKELNVPLDYLAFGKEYCLKHRKPDNLTTAFGLLSKKERDLFRDILKIIIEMIQ
ncbi:MAG: helix-turn-helix transcriptional regulator [Clostridia bacterium]|nr:helix-turn-helix transcriptional regulator [Clostridia bacterium]